ncbi:hypothetical protein [Microtetraspora malaysiensis]|uniref:hypothetical protein n=1 Tax=Microtetraspora malaysiensis TaxID=161358 RepID=UPI0012F93478|nr:hypothetical protein [Microtetraspora malaysiensis]
MAAPLGIADELFFGVPESELGRLARLAEAPGTAAMMAAVPADMPMFKATPPAVTPSAEYGDNPVVLTSDIPEYRTRVRADRAAGRTRLGRRARSPGRPPEGFPEPTA